MNTLFTHNYPYYYRSVSSADSAMAEDDSALSSIYTSLYKRDYYVLMDRGETGDNGDNEDNKMQNKVTNKEVSTYK